VILVIFTTHSRPVFAAFRLATLLPSHPLRRPCAFHAPVRCGCSRTAHNSHEPLPAYIARVPRTILAPPLPQRERLLVPRTYQAQRVSSMSISHLYCVSAKPRALFSFVSSLHHAFTTNNARATSFTHHEPFPTAHEGAPGTIGNRNTGPARQCHFDARKQSTHRSHHPRSICNLDAIAVGAATHWR
jgi:hypothetical protein